jgi:AcrR family transcriptional regulator
MEGRSRLTPEREEAIYETVVRLVGEHGYERLTVQQIAAETRASTATLYRRWDGKPRLVAESLRHSAPPPLADIDTGSLRGDFIEGARRMAVMSGKYEAILSALAHAAKSDPDLHDAMNEALAMPMAEAAHRILDRAAARGEIAPDTPGREFITELLLGSVIARQTVTGRPVDEDYLVRFVDAVIRPAMGVR